ncbi:MAG: bifunctional UDP-N-acetylmuramoyl-tripeptide:D-alanyl-D-alanine ligase/alanine racemase [Saprospiraceae bacterium]|nr:bifunctional UDP-N-acetylmuramoyl-tripeptide:D-alanyl-D-alanine ligase/alanine racemase [Saprospiraceae bacterium]
MSLAIDAIARIVDGDLIGPASSSQIEFLLFDSRQLKFPQRTLFFAIEGVRQDGHDFIPDLYAAGVTAFMVSKKIDSQGLPDAVFIEVDDVIHALQLLAESHRAHFDMPVIGITGSNGKTIVKEWLVQLLAPWFYIVKTPKSYNSQIGVPFSVWQLNDDCELAIFEAGISRPGEMVNLEKIIKPTLGIFTNIGSAHDEGFIDRAQKIREKCQLFKRCELVVVCLDHEEVFDALRRAGIPTYTWSRKNRNADLYLKVDTASQNTMFNYRTSIEQGVLSIPFKDPGSIENACHCMAVLSVLGEKIDSYSVVFKHLSPIEMRLDVREGVNGCIVVNDAYSADIESLSAALSFAKYQTNQRQKTIILTDFLQQSQPLDQLYARVARLLIEHAFNRVIGIGSEIQKIASFLPDEVERIFYKSVDELVVAVDSTMFQDELILIKGARSFALEQIAQLLSRKRHRTVLEINLAALARNLKTFESLLNGGTKIMAMVKAAAYGSGSTEIARFLASRNIDYLAVAYPDEGIELRKSGIQLPIMVLNVDASQVDLLQTYDLEPEVYSVPQLKSMVNFSWQADLPLNVHLKLETGMNRLGFIEEDIAEIGDLLRNSNHLEVVSLFSHLAASELAEEDDFSRRQIERFDRFADLLEALIPYRPLRHILNSHGIVRHPYAQYDMVRLGIGMYGIGIPELGSLERVHTLKSTVSQLKDVYPGDTIGYGRMERVKSPMRLAIVGVGYADGLIRKAGNRRYAVVLNGMRSEIVGNICMDMIMVDVTNLPDIVVGMSVTIFGKWPTVEALAKAADTIPYEVFTNLSERIKRIYTYD